MVSQEDTLNFQEVIGNGNPTELFRPEAKRKTSLDEFELEVEGLSLEDNPDAVVSKS